MRRKIRISFFLTLLGIGVAFVGACAVKNPSVPVVPIPDLFQGNWTSNCVEAQSYSLTTPVKIGITQMSRLKIDGEKFQEISSVSSQLCESNDIEFSVQGKYERQPTSKPAVVALVARFKEFRIRPITEFGMRVLNLSRWCGFNNWQIGEDRDVTELPIHEKCRASDSFAAVFSIEGKNLYFGTGERTISAANLALDLKKDFYFTRGEEK